jgi:hypothetical protein
MDMLKPQDVVVLLKIIFLGKEPWSYSTLAKAVGTSASEAHAAVQRATKSGLFQPQTRRVNLQAMEEFVLHGLRYAFPAERGPLTRGMPTAHSAPPLSGELRANGEPPFVWPDPLGEVRGEAIEPLYKSVPKAARNDERLYHGLALIDAIRAGRARERKLAGEHLMRMLAA